jgi:DNA-binding HxlR family transcriptional regulator
MEIPVFSPNVYDAHCPTRQVLNVVTNKWAPLMIHLLKERPLRFAELERQIGGISQKMLTQTLRSLERAGLVQRTVYPHIPPHVEYALTPLGQTLYEPFIALLQWAEEHSEAVTIAQQSYDTHPD